MAADLAWWSDSSHLLSGVSRVPPAGLPLLVRRLGSQLGGEPPLSLCFRPVVLRGGPSLHQPQGVEGDSPGVTPLRSFIEGSHLGGFRRQHHGSGVPAVPKGYIFPCPQQGGSTPSSLGGVAPDSPCPQLIMESRNVVSDSLSRQYQIVGSEWTLVQEVVNDLQRRWLVMVNLFASALNYRLPVYFSPPNDLMAVGTDTFLQSWDNLQACTFPPFSLICQVLC